MATCRCDGCRRDCMTCGSLMEALAWDEAAALRKRDREIETDRRLAAEVRRAEAGWLEGE